MDVSVGPGRGSAAGSAVSAYLFMGLRNLDPIESRRLSFFERFLNPGPCMRWRRLLISDFDDEGRCRVNVIFKSFY